MSVSHNLLNLFLETRAASEAICAPLQTEDYVVQPIVDVSPPKWHLGHTTWFFEEFLLSKYLPLYERYNVQYAFVFNSYYRLNIKNYQIFWSRIKKILMKGFKIFIF